MKQILYISCSPKVAAAVSSQFGQQVLNRLRARHPSAEINHRDLALAPAPFVDAAFCAAIANPAGDADAFGTSDILIEELERADAVVIATPMHNYTVPAVLKAWIDQVVCIRRSFVSTPAGKMGILKDRPVFVVVASGGWFTGPSPAGAPAQPDFLTPYLRAVLNTIGLTTIHVLTLEGVTRGSDALATAWTNAMQSLEQLVPTAT